MGAQRRIVIAMILLLTLLVLAPVGYMLIEGMDYNEAFYMTVITVFTVGFAEVEPLTTAGRYFTVFIIFVGVFNLFFLISGFIRHTLREAFRETFGRRRMDLRIRKLEEHYIVCGYGRVGEVVAEAMQEAGADFVVVEMNPVRIAGAVDHGYLSIEGDATETETLAKAGVERARGIVCALENDADNLFTSLSARTLNKKITIVTRCVSSDSVEKLHYAGADRVISPYEISGRRMAAFLLKPGVYDYLDLVAHGPSLEYRLEELVVESGSSLDGKTIGELDIKARTGALVLAIRKAESVDFNTNPDKETRMGAGDLIVALGMEEDLAGLERLVIP